MVPVALTPSIITRPAVGSSSPAMMLKIVLLPQPEGPIRLTKRPCGIASVTGASASKTPAGLLDVTLVLNVIPTSSTQSFGAGYDMRTPVIRGGARKFPQTQRPVSQKPCQPVRAVVLEMEVPASEQMAGNYSKCAKFRQAPRAQPASRSACNDPADRGRGCAADPRTFLCS